MHLQRAANVLFVPFSQAMKAIFFLCSGVAKPVWAAERKARRVVGREYAEQVLEQMALCRPAPPYELHRSSVLVSIAFDQTYVKAAGATGISAYSAVQTVDAHGDAVHRERMTYINGQFFPVPLAAAPLGSTARLVSSPPATAAASSPTAGLTALGRDISTEPSVVISTSRPDAEAYLCQQEREA